VLALIAEDNFLVGQALKLYLEGIGHEIVGVAPDADTAVRLAGEMHPDLALVDIQLARKSCGIDAARRMRALHGVRSLFVTANPDMAKLAQDAAIGCLTKPYTEAELITAIRAAEKWLQGQRPEHYTPNLRFFNADLTAHLESQGAGRRLGLG
jgi:two-component system, response regulator PdtaR